MKNLIFLLIFSFGIFNIGMSQSYVNKFVLNDFGNPVSDIDWAASTTDAQGNFITVGNTITGANQVEILTTKQNASGQIVWQRTWSDSSFTDSKSYGIVVQVDANGNVIIAGATTPDNEDNADYIIIKYSVSGTELWSKKVDGDDSMTDIPSALTIDTSGHVFVTGLSRGLTSQADYLTLKIHRSTGNILWSKKYDNQSSIDIAADITLDLAGNPIVTGGTSTNTVNWDYKTIKYDKSAGSLLNENTIQNTSWGVSVPTAIDKDTLGNFFILSNNGENVNNQNIRLTKLDANFNISWTTDYDLAGKKDEANAVTIGASGLIVVTATGTNSKDRSELLLLAYNSDGSLNWEQKRRSGNNQFNVLGKRSTVSSDGSIYTVGEIRDGNQSNLVILKFSEQGQRIWEQRHGLNQDYIIGLNHNDENLFVLAKSQNGTITNYYTLKFDEYQKNNPIELDSITGVSKYKKNEVVIKFNRDSLNLQNIDNLDLTFGDAALWLKQGAIQELKSRVDFDRTSFIRIFKNLKSTHTTSLSRLGEVIDIPDFYAVFIVDFPDGTNLDQTIQDLNTFFPTVKYAHPNYVATFTNNSKLAKHSAHSNDPVTLINAPNDPMYSEQASLHSTMDFDNVHINVEPFWAEVTGKSYIKVGVMDSGLDWEHEDFTYNNEGVETSVMVHGWDYNSNSSFDSAPPFIDVFGHGTRTAGIIGAIRNNEKGVAGIAGGYPNENENPLERGVSLYGLRVYSGIFFFDADLEYIADGIVTSSTDNPDIENAYGLHIMNHSWRFGYNFDEFTPENIQVIRDAIHFSNKNKVTLVAGRGNEGNSGLAYPACYDDDWIISVGGTGANGAYKTTDNGGSNTWSPSYGQNIDLAAPCITTMIRTTTLEGVYDDFQGTSAAAPHVAGVAALMMSYMNTPSPSYSNLAPEDVEFVLQKTTYDVNDTGYDQFTGFGRLNAGHAFHFIRQPLRWLLHFGTDINSSSFSTNLVNSNISINLNEPYENIAGQNFNTGYYTADVHKITATVNHNIASTDIILHSWERHSSSSLFPLVSSGEILMPYEKVNLVSVNQNQAVLEGFVYELKDISGNSLGWIPFSLSELDDAEFTYSLLVENSLVSKTDDINVTINIGLMPNPVTDDLQIQITSPSTSNGTISIIDALGKEIANLHQGKISKNVNLNFNTNQLPAGLYYLKVNSDRNIVTEEFIKQ